MNRRNAEYILRLNPRSLFPRVDDKLLTKDLASAQRIPTPPLYYRIGHHRDISGLEGALAGRREFVVKPARGSGGGGIVLIRDRTAQGYVTQSGEVISPEDFSYHLAQILSGVYSLEGREDLAMIEALIHADEVFAAVTYQGVPDIRMIVYRGVPAMAMVRLPTRASDGKANLHRGAVGAGIDLGGGTTTTAVHRGDLVTHHPDTGNPVRGIRVPDWGTILLMAARAWELSGLGYLGVDIIIDRDQGPLLLELNARPGLAIQLANRMGLLRRLEKIEQAPAEIFLTPESRVAWAVSTART